MKSISGRKLAKVLEQRGWYLLRIHRSHHIYGKEGSEIRISIPIHGKKALKIGLLKHILKLTGLTEQDLSL